MLDLSVAGLDGLTEAVGGWLGLDGASGRRQSSRSLSVPQKRCSSRFEGSPVDWFPKSSQEMSTLEADERAASSRINDAIG